MDSLWQVKKHLISLEENEEVEVSTVDKPTLSLLNLNFTYLCILPYLINKKNIYEINYEICFILYDFEICYMIFTDLKYYFRSI